MSLYQHVWTAFNPIGSEMVTFYFEERLKRIAEIDLIEDESLNDQRLLNLPSLAYVYHDR